MGGDLVDDHICIQKVTDHVSARAGCGRSHDLDSAAQVIEDALQETLGHLDRLALGGDVAVCE
jgi:hypothetical protein